MGKNIVSVSSFMGGLIKLMEQCSRFGTAKNYRQTLRSFLQFTGEDIPLSAITEQTIGRYNTFLLARGLTSNTVSFYMRTMKAMYNKAAQKRLVKKTDLFKNVYTGVDKTRKRAVDEELIARMYRLELPCGSGRELARDIFIFSYCTRGMAFVDIAYLKKSDIRDGVIHYTRRKTGRRLSVLIEATVGEIIGRYASRTAKSPYVFPILKSTGPSAAYKEYRSAINVYNRSLHEISTILNAGCPLTSHTARHSWATTAHRHAVPLSVISEGLGHISESTTQIYLLSLEASVIDAANRGIVESLSS